MTESYWVSYFWIKNDLTSSSTGYGRAVVSLPRRPPAFVDVVRVEQEICTQHGYNSVTILFFSHLASGE